MDYMETETQALERLRSTGYTGDFGVDDEGFIVERQGDGRWMPSEVSVDRVLRFEGMSDPGDESMIMAITGPNGARGTFVVAFGIDSSPEQTAALQGLLLGHRSRLERDTS